MNLAQRLVKAGVLEPEQLAPALFLQKKSRGYLAQHLLDLNLVEPGLLAQFVHAYPPLPETFEDLGLPKGLLIQLLLKHSFFRDFISSQEMAHDLKISRRLVDELFAYLKGQGYVQVKARDALSQTSQLSLELRYS
jgi:biotin operon repressor